jgi:predicted CXXCH cytochrome family protein
VTTKRERALRIAIAAALLTAAGSTAALATVVGTAHDFSTKGWSGGRICIVCHTPHGASQNVPLWNHAMTSATYALYTSPTMDVTAGQPGYVSKLCLSCHDGTVAVDSYGGNQGSEYATGTALLGTNLADDHPIGIDWKHQTLETSAACQNCHFNDGIQPVLPFYDGKLECATCHEPHNNGTGGVKFLRKTVAGSQLCLHCHDK